MGIMEYFCLCATLSLAIGHQVEADDWLERAMFYAREVGPICDRLARIEVQ